MSLREMSMYAWNQQEWQFYRVNTGVNSGYLQSCHLENFRRQATFLTDCYEKLPRGLATREAFIFCGGQMIPATQVKGAQCEKQKQVCQVKTLQSNTDVVFFMCQVYIQMPRNFILPVELSNHSRKKASKDKMSRNDGIILEMVFIQKEPNMLSVPFR